MARKIDKEKKVRGAIKKGDTFEAVTTIKQVDISGDGVDDLVYKHEAVVTGPDGTRGCVRCTIEWENLPQAVMQAFIDAMDAEDMDEGVQYFRRMKDLLHSWEKAIKTLGRINKIGLKYAEEELGE